MFGILIQYQYTDFLVYGVYFIKVYIMFKKKGYKFLNFGIEMKLYNYD